MDNITTSHALKTSIWMKPLNPETVNPAIDASAFSSRTKRSAHNMQRRSLMRVPAAGMSGEAAAVRRIICRFTISFKKFKGFVKIMAMKLGSHNPQNPKKQAKSENFIVLLLTGNEKGEKPMMQGKKVSKP